MAQASGAAAHNKTDKTGDSVAWLYDPKTRSIIFQVLLLAGLLFFFWWIISNTITNLEAQDKKSGFGFLSQNSGFNILPTLGTWLMGYTVGTSTYADIFWIGVLNTLAVAVTGIFAATVLGFIIGIMRLSNNFVLKGFATIYVELLRNVPLLLQMFFWYFAALRAMPDAREKLSFLDIFHINISGLFGPMPIPGSGAGAVLVSLIVAIAGAIVLSRWARRRQEATGQQFPAFWAGVGLIVGIPLVVFYIMGAPLSWEHAEFVETGPVFKRGFTSGVGIVIVPEMIAVWLALSLYTAAFIAEIVRAGILAVPHGQTEASGALGLRNGPTLRLVIIPQAMRVIIPPLTSQYLNLTKNSSLSVAIAYPELVSVFAGTALNQIGQEIEMIFMMMMVYLVISLGTSAFMNWFNDRMKLVER